MSSDFCLGSSPRAWSRQFSAWWPKFFHSQVGTFSQLLISILFVVSWFQFSIRVFHWSFRVVWGPAMNRRPLLQRLTLSRQRTLQLWWFVQFVV